MNLVDGLDEADLAEVNNLYACLNQGGHFSFFDDLIATLDSPTRTAEPAGLVFARLAEMGVELVYGERFSTVAGPSFDLN